MLELFKVVLDKLNPLAIATALRGRNNRQAAARLFLILVYADEVLELQEVLLRELEAALRSHRKVAGADQYFLNGAYIAGLLQRQASTLEVLEVLMFDLDAELRIIDPRFAAAFKAIFPGKFSILFDAQNLLSSGRLPLSEAGPDVFPADQAGVYRTLWFTWEAPVEDRAVTERLLHGWTGEDKQVVDVNPHDGERFFIELQRYLQTELPFERLSAQRAAVDGYRRALIESFTIEELLSDIGAVKRRYARVSDFS
ncbi:MAG: hypothetical protein P4M09_22245 [Devosia sp.]|nr:hypothetical protein [Devosia sp.]